MFSSFSLVLMVNHACNLRCSYCYTGAKLQRAMPDRIACRAIERAAGSVQRGGVLDLAFFGGEPLLEADRILRWIDYSQDAANGRSIDVTWRMTTNGTIVRPEAWTVMLLPEMDLTISCDGSAAAHDRHRRFANRKGSAALVHDTIRELVGLSKDFQVLVVVRPDLSTTLHRELEFLHGLGVRRFVLSLDLWTRWARSDVMELDRALERCGDLWREWLPEVDINWFSRNVPVMAGWPGAERASECGFGVGEVAVAPSGRLYPCERLIGEDATENPMRLPGHALDGEDFLGMEPSASRSADACDRCVLRASCSTSCRCSNYVRTGDVTRPDGLLCWVDKACFRETRRVLSEVNLLSVVGDEVTSL